jgi:hypothetical protein
MILRIDMTEQLIYKEEISDDYIGLGGRALRLGRPGLHVYND